MSGASKGWSPSAEKFPRADVERVAAVPARHRDEHFVAARRLLNQHRRDHGHGKTGKRAAPIVVPAALPRIIAIPAADNAA